MQQFFEWDEAKERSNYRKHGVLFEEAAQVFDDPLAVTEQDRIAGGKLRWQTIGMFKGFLLLLVAHTVRWAEDEDGGGGYEVIRIISARPADRKERKRYENGSIQTR